MRLRALGKNEFAFGSHSMTEKGGPSIEHRHIDVVSSKNAHEFHDHPLLPTGMLLVRDVRLELDGKVDIADREGLAAGVRAEKVEEARSQLPARSLDRLPISLYRIEHRRGVHGAIVADGDRDRDPGNRKRPCSGELPTP